MTRAILDPKEVDADDIGVNPSGEPSIADLIEIRMNRRAALKGLLAVGAYGLFGCAAPGPRSAAGEAPLTFSESGRFLDEMHHVSPGYDVQVLIRWGDPIRKSGPRFKPGAQSAAEQQVQFGMDNDFIAYMPLPRASKSSERGLLCVNHERNTPHLSWPGMTAVDYASKMTPEQMEVEMASQGHTVIEIARSGARLTGRAPMTRRAVVARCDGDANPSTTATSATS